MRWFFVAHALLILVWGLVLVGTALSIAGLGSEEQRLTRQRGEDYRQRKALAHERQRVERQLEWVARRERVEAAVRTLGLPLGPQGRPLAPREPETAALARWQRVGWERAR